jgi:hypothetical protein
MLGSGPAEATNELGPDEIDLAVEVLPTVRHFLRFRRAVAGRPAFDHVANVDFFPLEPGSDQDAVEELSRGADERFAESIFVRARGLADQQQRRVNRPDAEHRLPPGADQFRTARARANSLRQ